MIKWERDKHGRLWAVNMDPQHSCSACTVPPVIKEERKVKESFADSEDKSPPDFYEGVFL